MKKLLLLSCLAVGVASADIIPELVVGSGGVTCAASGPGFTCTYNYVATVHDKTMLTADQQSFTEFFTIYDFNGYAGQITSPAGWTSQVAIGSQGLTPSNVSVSQDNSIPDLTWIYQGASNVPGGTTIAGFSATSFFGPTTVQGMFTSQSTNNTADPTVAGTWVQNVGFVGVPNPNDLPGDEIPEPMTMGLIGSGLFAFALLRRRK